MNTNELRRGNIVWDGYSGSMIVDTIWPDDLLLRKKMHLPTGKYSATAVRGLRLNDEILVKAGFEKGVGANKSLYCKEKFVIDDPIPLFDNFGYSFRITTDYQHSTHVANIRDLHQLQNVYFCATGEELTIDL